MLLEEHKVNMPIGFAVKPVLHVQKINPERRRATSLIPKRYVSVENTQQVVTPTTPLISVKSPVSTFKSIAPITCLKRFELASTSIPSPKILSTFQGFARTEFGLDLSMWVESSHLQFQDSAIRSVFFDSQIDSGLVLASRTNHGMKYRVRNIVDMVGFIRNGYSTISAYDESLGISGFSFGGLK